MGKYRILLDFETDDDITLGMITRGLEYNDGTIRNAIFSEYPNIVGDSAVSYKIVEAREFTVKPITEGILDEKIDFSLFSVRTIHGLKTADIETVRDLVWHRKSDLVQSRLFGKKALEELDTFLEHHGLHWGMSV